MATQRHDLETLAAIRDHWAARHGQEISDDAIAIARRGHPSKPTKVLVTPETRASPAWFSCLACPEDARRYRVDVGISPIAPPPRHIAAIRRHFRLVHGVRRLHEGRIYGGSHLPALALYGPSTPLSGAHVVCALCPEGNNRVDIEDPPYGDARSFVYLTMHYPDLTRELTGLDPLARANRLESHHRGIVVPAATQAVVERALRRARSGPRTRRLTETQTGIQAVLLKEVRSGEPITSVISELALMARDNRAAYAEYIAREIPAMRPYLGHPPQRLAELLTEFCGKPATTARALWSIWERIPARMRRDAQQGYVDQAEPNALQ